MALRDKGKTYPYPGVILAPKDRTATSYSDVIDCIPNGNAHRELAIIVACDAETDGSASATPSLQYAAGLTNISAYDYTTLGDTWVTLRYNTNDQIMLAHKFTTAASGAAATCTIHKVKFYMKRVGTIAASTYVWATLEGESTGAPDGSAIQTSYKIAAAGIGTSGEYVTFQFREPIALTAATAYYVVLQGDWTLSTSNHLAVYVDTVASGGTLYVYDSGWANTSTQSPNTLCEAIGTWTAVTPEPSAFAAITAVNEDVVSSVQTKYLNVQTYGRYVRLVLTETATWTTCLSTAFAVLMGPSEAH